jgi:hypothetical protein
MDIDKDESKSYSETSTEIVASWNTHQENLLKGIAERSNCMRWLHSESNQYFDNLNFYFTIPNVIISTLNGSFTMSLTSLFPDPASQKSATTLIGLISIFSAVLITMNQYVKSQQMMEAHRAAGLSYGKLYRVIMNELALRRDQRSNGLDFLKLVRIEIDSLENTAPTILPFIIRKFLVRFADRNIEKPEIAGDLDPVSVNTDIKNRGLNCVVSPRVGGTPRFSHKLSLSNTFFPKRSSSSSSPDTNVSPTVSKDENTVGNAKESESPIRINVPAKKAT